MTNCERCGSAAVPAKIAGKTPPGMNAHCLVCGDFWKVTKAELDEIWDIYRESQ